MDVACVKEGAAPSNAFDVGKDADVHVIIGSGHEFNNSSISLAVVRPTEGDEGS